MSQEAVGILLCSGARFFLCPCKVEDGDANGGAFRYSRSLVSRKMMKIFHVGPACRGVVRRNGSWTMPIRACGGRSIGSLKKKFRAHKIAVANNLSSDVNYEDSDLEPLQLDTKFTNYQQDHLVEKLRTQLGVIHPLPAPPISRNIAGFFVFFFFVGVVVDKFWTSRKKNKSSRDNGDITWPQVPTSFSMFFEKDLLRKESVEWVNMVLEKLWKVYRSGIENWIIGLLQPVIDNLEKPNYVQRVEIKQFSLGDEPLIVRNIERRTSRSANDLQYHIGLRYTGGARMLLSLSLKFGFIPLVVPVGVRDFDIDGELWVKLRLIPTEPWVGSVSWAFVSLPKTKFELSPFRSFNIMAIPVLSMFLTKLLTEDLPRLFVRPKKIVLDFQKGKTQGPVVDDLRENGVQEGNKDFVGELSVTLVDARKLAYVIFGKTDPYVILSLGNQAIQSKKNSQTTVTGSPGEPIWNQDFHLLVADPRKEKLYIRVKDSFGLTDFTIGTGEVDLGSLQDTVPTDKIVALQGGWSLFGKGNYGEILLRLTYKAYVEDEEDDALKTDSVVEEILDYEQASSMYEESNYASGIERETFMDLLAALLVSEEFQGIMASESASTIIFEGSAYPGSVSRSRAGKAETSVIGPEDVSGRSRDLVLAWLAIITSTAVLIALNMGGSSYFNP